MLRGRPLDRPRSPNEWPTKVVTDGTAQHNVTASDAGESFMPFVVLGNCIFCKHTECAAVCPASCFHEGPDFLVIDPDECIDCMYCVPACPIGAIVELRDVPMAYKQFVQINADLARVWPRLRGRLPPPPDAEEWDGVPDKSGMVAELR